ncbi:MAG: hypothetical protein RBT63_06355, partial [Bdellovibrionales bacterium]|nr:hypothetical protein [Bdellovibrionales bacterium]
MKLFNVSHGSIANLIVLSFVFSALVGCGEVKKLDEMKDNTSEMNKTTKTLLEETSEMNDGLEGMSKTTDGMSETTAEMLKTTHQMNEQMTALLALTQDELVRNIRAVEQSTSELYDAMRQGDASALRRASLQRLQTTRTLQGRVAEAGLYLMSYEFQLLGSVGQDTHANQREVLYHQAVLEFFLMIDELAPAGGKIWPEALPEPGEEDSEENPVAAFNAIAFTLHKTNRKQQVDPAFGRPVSMYDLIIHALRMTPEID